MFKIFLKCIFLYYVIVLVIILISRYCGDYGSGVHLFPFRTEKLRPLALMVLPMVGE